MQRWEPALAQSSRLGAVERQRGRTPCALSPGAQTAPSKGLSVRGRPMCVLRRRLCARPLPARRHGPPLAPTATAARAAHPIRARHAVRAVIGAARAVTVAVFAMAVSVPVAGALLGAGGAQAGCSRAAARWGAGGARRRVRGSNQLNAGCGGACAGVVPAPRLYKRAMWCNKRAWHPPSTPTSAISRIAVMMGPRGGARPAPCLGRLIGCIRIFIIPRP